MAFDACIGNFGELSEGVSVGSGASLLQRMNERLSQNHCSIWQSSRR